MSVQNAYDRPCFYMVGDLGYMGDLGVYGYLGGLFNKLLFMFKNLCYIRTKCICLGLFFKGESYEEDF